MSIETNAAAHKGKTQRDRASGALARRVKNQQARATWQNDRKNEKFPYHLCNGYNGRRYKRWVGIN